MKAQRKRVQIDCSKESHGSMTKQAFKDECDINKIVAKYHKTNQITHLNRVQGSYGDFSQVSDYQSALNAVMAAQDAFMGLSSKIRARFGNNPAEFLNFVSDDKNYEEALKLGLLDDEKKNIYLQKLAEKQKSQTPPSPTNDDKTTIKG